MSNILSNLIDTAGKWVNETFIDTSELRRQLKGFHAVDTPLSQLGLDTYETGTKTKKQQLDKQVLWTLKNRNELFNRIDSIADHHIAKKIRDVIISDGFNEVNNSNEMFIKYTDPENPEKAAQFTEDIRKMIRRTGFLEILRDNIFSEGFKYGELFLSKQAEYGRGIIEVVDDIDLRDHIAIYSKANFLGAVRLKHGRRSAALDGDFIPASKIAHFMLNYERKNLHIVIDNKNYERMQQIIKEKIRCAAPILEPVIDLIKQYNQLEVISGAIELARAIQPILLGVGVSPEQDIGKITKQLQDWSNALNKNKNSVINSIQSDLISQETLLKNMNTIELIPYDVENNANAMRQISLNYGETNLIEKINDVRKTIAMAVGIPEQYISTTTYNGQKDTKEDTIQTNPCYSMMLSRIQILIAKGLRDFAYDHLKTKYSTEEGILKRDVDKDKIEVIFESSTNLNDRLENESMMLRGEMMSSLLSVVDSVAGSPNIDVKVSTDAFLEMWQSQFRNTPSVRNVFVKQTAEDIKVQRGDLGLPDSDETTELPKIEVPVQQDNVEKEEEAEANFKEEARDRKSEQAEKERNMKKAENDGDDAIRGLLG